MRGAWFSFDAFNDFGTSDASDDLLESTQQFSGPI